jgi:hypothetical protein
LIFQPKKRRKVKAEFSGGDITSDGGVLLLRQIDRRLGLLKAVDALIHDPRDQRYIEHSQLSLPAEVAQDRCSDPAQYAADSFSALKCLSLSVTLLRCRCATQFGVEWLSAAPAR